MHSRMRILIPFVRCQICVALALCGAGLLTLAASAAANCPSDQPPDCAIEDQFASGRWDLSQITGSYNISGSEQFYPFLKDDLVDDYETSGTLDVEMVGGPEQNYIDVECDGTVTGQATERFTGSIEKMENVWYFDPKYCTDSPYDMNWDVTIERTYSISGNVTGAGTLDLDLQVHTATVDISGQFAASEDCLFFANQASTSGFDISGDTEQVTLSGSWAPGQTTWNPTVSPRGGTNWLDDIAHRLKLNGDYEITNCGGDSCQATFWISPELTGSTSQPARQKYNTYFLQNAVTVTGSLQAMAEPQKPEVTSFSLDEPTAYLQDVAVTTRATAEIDWRGQPPGQVEFTYGGTIETIPGADSVTWDFDAGESGTTISAVAIQGSERSEPYEIAVPKVTVPGWAGSAGDWSGQPGVRYEATLDWPVSLQTTQTLDTISLFTGLWGIDGSASSEFNAKANSSGAPGSGDLETSASIQYASKSFSFEMSGENSTTLACDELTTTGSATATVDAGTWQKTLNPLTSIPGLQPVACGLSGLLCSAINAIGIKASATVTLEGTATFTGEGAEIRWDGGSLGGSIEGRIGAGASLPPPISSLASVEVYGGGTGCIEFQVAPDFELTQVAGELEVGATVSFLGLGGNASETWPFGGGCGRAPAPGGGFVPSPKARGGSSGVGAFVPADGQLATAATLVDGDLVGIAVWSQLPNGQARPSGDIWYRIWRQGGWGALHQLTADADADGAPAVVFEPNDEPLIVWQRSVGPVPTQSGELEAFANGYELHWARIDLLTELPEQSGALTSNASNDYGARLVRDAGGAVHLFWQRVGGVDLIGSPIAPARLMVASWEANSATWSPEEVVADGLVSTWGWSAAAFSADEMLVGLVVDTDQDPATDADRELYQIQRLAGTWLLPVQITSNAEPDDSVLAAFDSAGLPQLVWRRGNATRQLRGDLAQMDEPGPWTPDPQIDEGIGLGFAHGQLLPAPGGLLALWPESTEVLLSRDLVTNSEMGWTAPNAPLASLGGAIQQLHSARVAGGTLLVGYATRSFTSDFTAVEAQVEPRFARLAVQPLLFVDGFESGGTSAWTSTAP